MPLHSSWARLLALKGPRLGMQSIGGLKSQKGGGKRARLEIGNWTSSQPL